ncbi:MAG: hypothetical protein ACOC33_02845 [bacterium]
MTKNELLICECHSPEHQIMFSYDDESDWDEVFISIHLNKRPFWERVKYGIKYILGRQCNYGAFDEVVLKSEDYKKLENIVNYLKKVDDNKKKLNL